MKIKNWGNAQPAKGERNSGVSETIPGQAMSVAEMYKRLAQGLPVDGARVPLFEFVNAEDESFDGFPDPETLDLAERQEFADLAKQQLAEIKDRANQKAAEIKARKDAQAAQKAAQKAIADEKLKQAEQAAKGQETDQNTN